MAILGNESEFRADLKVPDRGKWPTCDSIAHEAWIRSCIASRAQHLFRIDFGFHLPKEGVFYILSRKAP